jgi:hypothetical protein
MRTVGCGQLYACTQNLTPHLPELNQDDDQRNDSEGGTCRGESDEMEKQTRTHTHTHTHTHTLAQSVRIAVAQMSDNTQANTYTRGHIPINTRTRTHAHMHRSHAPAHAHTHTHTQPDRIRAVADTRRTADHATGRGRDTRRAKLPIASAIQCTGNHHEAVLVYLRS